MNYKSLITLLSLIILSSCVKDKPQPAASTSVNISSAKKVYVINEGNFGSPNASISLFDPSTGAVVADQFFSQNNIALGDVAQSMTKINNDYYIVVNNSNKIVVCDGDLKIKRTITGLISPRYIQQVSNHKAYVTDLYANAISIIDLNTGTKTGSISCPGKTEQMVMLYNKVYVTNYDRDKVYVINATTDKIEDSVLVGFNASSLVIDKNDKLWVLEGSSTPIMTCWLTQIDPISLALIKYVSFTNIGMPTNLCINGTKDTLYFLNSDVYRMSINNGSPGSFIPKGGKNFYGLAVHPTNHNIYVSDALDYTSPSNIYIYNSVTGTEKQKFTAGLLANGFYFE